MTATVRLCPACGVVMFPKGECDNCARNKKKLEELRKDPLICKTCLRQKSPTPDGWICRRCESKPKVVMKGSHESIIGSYVKASEAAIDKTITAMEEEIALLRKAWLMDTLHSYMAIADPNMKELNAIIDGWIEKARTSPSVEELIEEYYQRYGERKPLLGETLKQVMITITNDYAKKIKK